MVKKGHTWAEKILRNMTQQNYIKELFNKADRIIYTALLGLYQDNGLSISAANRESVKNEILTKLKE